jgi:hypothetical protein
LFADAFCRSPALVAALAVLVEIDEGTERANTRDGFWLGAVAEALNDHDGKGVTLRNVRTGWRRRASDNYSYRTQPPTSLNLFDVSLVTGAVIDHPSLVGNRYVIAFPGR